MKEVIRRRNKGVNKNNRKKKPFFQLLPYAVAIFAIIILAVICIVILVKSSSDVNSTSSTTSQASNGESNESLVSSSDAVSETDNNPELNTKEADQWYLRLVNSKSKLPTDYNAEVSLIDTKYVRDQGMKFDSRAVGALNSMCVAAAKDGISLLVISPYRSITKQTSLYNSEVQKWTNQGYSNAEAAIKAASIVAAPGTSEHNLGLAVDFNSVEQSFENTKQFAWLQKNAANFGFVMRYPKTKQDITAVIYEPWHYRYVTVEHAKKMNDLSMCLEEYIEHLTK